MSNPTRTKVTQMLSREGGAQGRCETSALNQRVGDVQPDNPSGLVPPCPDTALSNLSRGGDGFVSAQESARSVRLVFS